MRALADGTPRIDQTRLEVGKGGTEDISFIHGHYYAAKSPGLAFETLAPYLALKGAGGANAGRESRGQVWYLNLWGAVLPTLLLLILVRFVVNGLEPGFGTAAAITLGLTTMVLPFATLFFSHALSATLAFAAFAALWRERRGPPRLGLVLCSGLLAGLAATAEFPVAAIGAILALYAVARANLPLRLAAYAGGAFLGGLPTLLFNRWAFGNAFTFSYANVVTSPGANKVGLFGITTPKFDVLVQLLFAPSGLLTLTPVIIMGAVGLGLLYRRGYRAEALLAGGIAVIYLLINAGYESPFGGDSPGPRFLVAILPFLALGLGAAYRRAPLTTGSLAICSAVQMVVLTLTNPMLTDDRAWFHRFASGQFVQTSLGLAGVHDLALPLFFTALAAALVFTALESARPGLSWCDVVRVPLAVGGWILLGRRTPHLLDENGPWAVLGIVQVVVLTILLTPRALVRGAPGIRPVLARFADAPGDRDRDRDRDRTEGG